MGVRQNNPGLTGPKACGWQGSWPLHSCLFPPEPGPGTLDWGASEREKEVHQPPTGPVPPASPNLPGQQPVEPHPAQLPGDSRASMPGTIPLSSHLSPPSSRDCGAGSQSHLSCLSHHPNIPFVPLLGHRAAGQVLPAPQNPISAQGRGFSPLHSHATHPPPAAEAGPAAPAHTSLPHLPLNALFVCSLGTAPPPNTHTVSQPPAHSSAARAHSRSSDKASRRTLVSLRTLKYHSLVQEKSGHRYSWGTL